MWKNYKINKSFYKFFQIRLLTSGAEKRKKLNRFVEKLEQRPEVAVFSLKDVSTFINPIR